MKSYLWYDLKLDIIQNQEHFPLSLARRQYTLGCHHPGP